MSLEATPLLQEEEEAVENEEKIDFKQMVWFHGKELANKSLMRGPQSNLVRLGVGKDGIYKLDSKTAKVLKHWRFREIKDFNYSGYSFTLQLKIESDYFMRTDDGEAICSYIEAFQKDPTAALEEALNNPPMSKIPESGVLTLRRKFSSQPDSKSPANDVKFYTLNRRPKKNPGASDPHNIEVDSRLRPLSGTEIENNRSRAFSFGYNEKEPKVEVRRQKSLEGFLDQTSVNGVKEEDKKFAREILSSTIEKAAHNQQRHSNGILMSPVSTKGEVTMTQSTKSSPHKASPLMERKKLTQNSPSPAQKNSPPPAEVEQPKILKEPSPEPSSKKSPEPSKEKNSNEKKLDLGDDRAPLLRQTSSSSSDAFSPTGEFRFIPQGPSTSREGSKEPVDRVPSSASSDAYDRLESFVGDRPNSTASSGSRPNSKLRIRVSASPESEGSGTYDHLPALPEPVPYNAPERLKALQPSDFSAPRRITSQPALSTPVSARESPIERMRSTSPVLEESSDEAGTPTNSDDEIKIGEDEGKVHFEQVKLREKKNRPKADPFAELLNNQASARLRWSQELNPLYDIIKGFKVSDGVKLYDTPSKLLESANASDLVSPAEKADERNSYKPSAAVIVEEDELGQLSHEETISPSDASLYSPPASESSRPTSSFSEDIPTSPTHYTRREHVYEDISLLPDKAEPRKLKGASLIHNMKRSVTEPTDYARQKKGTTGRAATLNLGVLEAGAKTTEQTGRSPRIGKRELQQQRRSRTIGSLDDTETVKKKQKPVRASDELKDFSFVMREFRLFFIKLPNGHLHRQIFSINKPVSELKDRLCDVLGVDNLDNYLLYVEGACLTTVKESDSVPGDLSRINRTGSLNHLVDSQSLPDQGSEPMLLKSNLSLRMQGISTSRIMNLLPDDEATDNSFAAASDICTDIEEDFPKDWLSIVQGIMPVGQDDAVKLAALQYQAYFLDRTAVHSTVGFCRPTEFLPVEYAGIRGLEQKMYKEQEALKSKTHSEVNEAYTSHCAKLATHNAVFFPAREPRKKLLQSTKLKPVLLGVSPKGILRVDPKTKEVLDFWDFMVLKNWAYSKRTFVLAFANKNYPVESNQSKWISQLVDFHVDSIVSNDQGIPFSPPEESQKP